MHTKRGRREETRLATTRPGQEALISSRDQAYLRR